MSNNECSKEGLFIGFLLGLFLGVPLAFMDLGSAIERVLDSAAYIVLFLILIVAIFAILYVFRRKIVSRIFGGAQGKLTAIIDESKVFTQATIERDTSLALSSVQNILNEFAAWYGWVSLRTWVVSAVLGLMFAFAATAGTLLLYKQNQLITEHNKSIQIQVAIGRAEIADRIDRSLLEMFNIEGSFLKEYKTTTHLDVMDDELCLRLIVQDPGVDQANASERCNQVRLEMGKLLGIFEDISHLLSTKALDETTVRTSFISSVGSLCSRQHIMDYISLYRSVDNEYLTGLTDLAEIFPRDVSCKPIRSVNEVFEYYKHSYRQ